MADIDGLKQRIELIDLRLTTAHSARERESTALVDMWEQIRNRLQNQNKEILAQRDRIRVLEDTRNDLQNMVDNLLGAVEGGLERMSDETVPNIREMANGLLNETEIPTPYRQEIPAPTLEPFASGIDDTGHSDPVDDGEADDDEFLAALERSTKAENTPALDDDNVLSLDTPIDTPVSAGIQALVARIENSAGGIVTDHSDAGSAEALDTPPSSDGLQQDLQEIEQLRNELLGLRERISGTGS